MEEVAYKPLEGEGFDAELDTPILNEKKFFPTQTEYFKVKGQEILFTQSITTGSVVFYKVPEGFELYILNFTLQGITDGTAVAGTSRMWFETNTANIFELIYLKPSDNFVITHDYPFPILVREDVSITWGVAGIGTQYSARMRGFLIKK